eukprot:CAMPEP_0183719216 /NCGR_PEP_ID=MMETSP0737-20130205/12261_1 /TAXON_ID=385413 /ORGANISM="Thalassiosira miniscula, Strain CCMP1093" /LENGTH=247 /DNA_ID=CAMNT_0025948927 /DNA_START=115 /DNA_END=854 /DNA_ORIENTATION=+
MSDFNDINNEDDAMDSNSNSEDASWSSEDSQEPYYHVMTGNILPARDAWTILADEGHPRYTKKDSATNANVDSAFRPSGTADTSSSGRDTPPPPTTTEEAPPLESEGSFTAPTQSSIDRALHPESPNYISPTKDIKNVYKKSTSHDGSHHSSGIVPSGIMDLPPDSDDEDAHEADPIILRAKAMALAAQNGQKLTPEQMQLIAQPDVQQQKLIEEAKRVQKAKEMAAAKEQKDQLIQQFVEAPKQIG